MGKTRDHNGAAERDLCRAGFDVLRTLDEQNYTRLSDKSDEGHKSHVVSRRPPTDQGSENTVPTNTQIPQSNQSTSTPPDHGLFEQIREVQQAGLRVGIPVHIEFDAQALAAVMKTQPPLVDDLARFAAKAAVASAVGLVTAVTYSYLMNRESM